MEPVKKSCTFPSLTEMRILLFIGVMATASTHCNAQEQDVVLYAGPGKGQLHSKDIFKQADPTVGHRMGAGYQRWYPNGLGFHLQVNSIRMGGELPLVLQGPEGQEYGSRQTVYQFDHWGFALGGSFRTPGRLHAELHLGFMPTLVHRASMRAPDIERVFDPKAYALQDLTEKMGRPIQFAYGSGGLGYHITENLSIGIHVCYDVALNTLSNPEFFREENLRETAWMSTIAVAYRWHKGGG